MHIAGRAYDIGYGGSKPRDNIKMAVSEGHAS